MDEQHHTASAPFGRLIHWRRWLLAGPLAGASFALFLLPLQAAEILHFRLYEVRFDPIPHFLSVAAGVLVLASGLGIAMGALGIVREAWLERRPRPWPWWAPVLASLPAALLVHVFEWPGFVAAGLLAHVIANGVDRERRWIRLGVIVALLLVLPFTNPVRRLYAEHVIRVFHFERLRYMDVYVWARKGGQQVRREEGSGYLPSIDELPLRPGELFWLGIVSLTLDPWGHPYHFDRSRRVAEGWLMPDYGRWSVDYTFASYGSDGLRGGTGSRGDIFPENVLAPEDVPPSRIRPTRDPAKWRREPKRRGKHGRKIGERAEPLRHR